MLVVIYLLRTVLSGFLSGQGEIDIWNVVIYILSALVVIFLTMPVHEFAHAFAANKLGDPNPRYMGRLTLNPLAHIDYFGALCIILFGFGWAKPVEINMRNFSHPKRDMAITAFAGPLSNLIVAFIAMLVLNGIYTFAGLSSIVVFYIYMFFQFIASINIGLAVFNLIPIPPLDGSRLLAAFLPNRQYYALMRYERYISLTLIALIWFGALDLPLNFLTTKVWQGLNAVASLPFSLF